MRTTDTILALGLALIAILAPGVIQAQQGSIAIDRVTCRFQGDTVLLPGNVTFVLRYTNNTGMKVDISDGFRVSSPDGAYWDSTTVMESAGGTFAAYFDVVFYLGIAGGYIPGDDTIGVLGSGTPTAPNRRLPDGYTGTPVTITLWNLPETNHGKHVCLDSSFFTPGGTWKWVSVNGGVEYTYKPTFSGLSGQAYSPGSGYCFYLYHMPCAVLKERLDNQSAVAVSGCPCSICCTGTTGDVNGAGIVDLSDLSALVAYLTGGGYVLPCEEEANINAAGIVDLSDLSSLVSYLTGGGYVLPSCPL
ncbi:hypothetical protein C3F09_00190 [candidate division GN15 bacterium]|uniref:Dockerin domain-containing protein n=1 Tax=candidate division GN15 bacterium TaxID=2072418 RepID=A0A855XDT1_9BACT|nr:MAG: hypothetical protein C3F09_00190 [candidate division GN15 bacterium]